MAHEILSVKLCELDDRVGKLHSRIQTSETLSPDMLHHEILAFSHECNVNEQALSQKLEYSRAGMVSVLSDAYKNVKELIRQAQNSIAAQSEHDDAPCEDQILLAEYALDFAIQASERAVLFSMQAIEAQQEEEGCLR